MEMSEELVDSAIDEMVCRYVEEENGLARRWHCLGVEKAAIWAETASMPEMIDWMATAFRLLKARPGLWDAVCLPEGAEQGFAALTAEYGGVFVRASFVRGWVRGLCLTEQRLNRVRWSADKLVYGGFF